MILLLAAERGSSRASATSSDGWARLSPSWPSSSWITGGNPLVPKSSPSTAVRPSSSSAGVVLVGDRVAAPAGPGGVLFHRAPEGAQVDGQHRPGQPFDRRRPGLPPTALGSGGGRVSTIVQAKLNSGWPVRRLSSTFCVWCSASILTMEIYAVARPATVQGQAQRAARVDQLAYGPGHRHPVARPRALPDGQEHLRAGQRELEPRRRPPPRRLVEVDEARRRQDAAGAGRAAQAVVAAHRRRRG